MGDCCSRSPFRMTVVLFKSLNTYLPVTVLSESEVCQTYSMRVCVHPHHHIGVNTKA